MAEPLDELIARLEQATGPDRALDWGIVKAIYPEARMLTWPAEEPRVVGAEPLVSYKTVIPRYTASLDASLALVPEGLAWAASNIAEGDDECRAWAAVMGPSTHTEVLAKSAALALCIAALKARAAIGVSDSPSLLTGV